MDYLEGLVAKWEISCCAVFLFFFCCFGSLLLFCRRFDVTVEPDSFDFWEVIRDGFCNAT